MFGIDKLPAAHLATFTVLLFGEPLSTSRALPTMPESFFDKILITRAFPGLGDDCLPGFIQEDAPAHVWWTVQYPDLFVRFLPDTDRLP